MKICDLSGLFSSKSWKIYFLFCLKKNEGCGPQDHAAVPENLSSVWFIASAFEEQLQTVRSGLTA
jgi:hypothetical protein